MALCRNCGQEIPAGMKFCGNCGAPVEVENTENERIRLLVHVNEDVKNGEALVWSGQANYSNETAKPPKGKITMFFGIGLMILSILLFFFGDPPVVTIIIAVAILTCSIICLAKKYRLKGFTITALVIACLCIIGGVLQGLSDGWTTIPNEKSFFGSSNSRKVDPKYAGVDPELKAFLDSYEDFVDDYVAFMKKYLADPMNVLSMLSEYTDIMAKYDDFSRKLDKYDSSKMSTLDAQYYLEVTTRCTQKMLDIYK